MITISINLDKIEDKHIYIGKKGRYLNLTVLENDYRDDYGNDYMVAQGVSKEARDKGERGPILGNGKYIEAARHAKPAARRTAPAVTSTGPDPQDAHLYDKPAAAPGQDAASDEIPF